MRRRNELQPHCSLERKGDLMIWPQGVKKGRDSKLALREGWEGSFTEWELSGARRLPERPWKVWLLRTFQNQCLAFHKNELWFRNKLSDHDLPFFIIHIYNVTPYSSSQLPQTNNCQVILLGDFIYLFSPFWGEGLLPSIWTFPGWGWIWAPAAGLHHSHSNTGSESCLQPTPQLTASNTTSLTHWTRPGIEPVSSWILVRIITAEPQWELHEWLLNVLALLFFPYESVLLSVHIPGMDWDRGLFLLTEPAITGVSLPRASLDFSSTSGELRRESRINSPIWRPPITLISLPGMGGEKVRTARGGSLPPKGTGIPLGCGSLERICQPWEKQAAQKIDDLENKKRSSRHGSVVKESD